MISSEKPLLTTSQSAGNSSNFWLISSYDILRYIDAFLKQVAPLFHTAVNKTIVQRTAAPVCLLSVFQPNEVLFCPTTSPISFRAKNIQKQKDGQRKCSQPHNVCETAAQKHHSELRAQSITTHPEQPLALAVSLLSQGRVKGCNINRH